MREQHPTPAHTKTASAPSDARELDAARRARMRQMAALTPAERLERLHHLCAQMARVKQAAAAPRGHALDQADLEALDDGDAGQG
jgi:hypothetical protein